MDLTSFFNALAVLRVFSVVLATRSLVFDIIQDLTEVTALIILLIVSGSSARLYFFLLLCGIVAVLTPGS